jgi:1-acyl-sn-glycerol-3-phosphate acyltransferase
MMEWSEHTPVVNDAWRPLRYLLRGTLLSLHLLIGLPIALLLINPLTSRLRLRDERIDDRTIRAWSTVLLRIFGFRLRRIGRPLPGGVLMVANHVSWIDITLLHSQHAVGFVAKAEISRWPVIGWLGRRAGTVYHHRGSNASLLGVQQQMQQRLLAGRAVGVFPEGGTGNGSSLRVFHARIFQAAIETGVPIQPVALRFGERGSAQVRVAFAPGESFLGNFFRLLGDPGCVAEVHFLEPLPAQEGGRRAIAELARTRIIEALDT